MIRKQHGDDMIFASFYAKQQNGIDVVRCLASFKNQDSGKYIPTGPLNDSSLIKVSNLMNLGMELIGMEL